MADGRRPSVYNRPMAAIAPPPVRRVSLDDIRAAHERIRGVVTRTPLIRLRHDVAGAPEIWLKLENLQPINAFKIRGAANAVSLLSAEARSKGVWTISAGNAGQGVAYAAREAGIPCTVLVIETAPETKIERMRNLGATRVKAPFDACWNAMEERAYPGIEGTFVHPFDDHDFIAGNATIGIEILEDMPNVKAVFAADGHEDGLHVGHVFEDLDADGGVAGDEVMIVERMDERALDAGIGALFHRVPAGVERRLHPRRAEVAHPLDLRLGRGLDHQHRARNPRLAR